MSGITRRLLLTHRPPLTACDGDLNSNQIHRYMYIWMNIRNKREAFWTKFRLLFAKKRAMFCLFYSNPHTHRPAVYNIYRVVVVVVWPAAATGKYTFSIPRIPISRNYYWETRDDNVDERTLLFAHCCCRLPSISRARLLNSSPTQAALGRSNGLLRCCYKITDLCATVWIVIAKSCCSSIRMPPPPPHRPTTINRGQWTNKLSQ